MSQDKSTSVRPDFQECPDCGGELLRYDDPETGPEVVCTECVRWALSDEFNELEVSVRLARVRRAV